MLDQENILQINMLLAYFFGQKDMFMEISEVYRKQYSSTFAGFQIPKFSPDKGILLMGEPGSGKTQLMRIFQRILLGLQSPNHFRFFVAWQVANEYQSVGLQAIEKWRNFKHTCFDEIAISRDREIRNSWGNRSNVVEDLILMRYDLFDVHGVLSHFTTNATPHSFAEIYQPRTVSRILGMCNVIVLTGTDRRPFGENVHRSRHVDMPKPPAPTAEEIGETWRGITEHLQQTGEWKTDIPVFQSAINQLFYPKLKAMGLIDVSDSDFSSQVNAHYQRLEKMSKIELEMLLDTNITRHNKHQALIYHAEHLTKLDLAKKAMLGICPEVLKQKFIEHESNQ